MSRGMVYIISNCEIKNRIKIGVTIDIENRIKTIKNTGGCNIELIYLSDTILNPFEIENRIHEHFKSKRHLGEWFNIDCELAKNVTKSFIKEYSKINNQIKRLKEQRKVIEEIEEEIKYEINYNLNINRYKRIKPGIYADKKGDLYSIKYRLSDGGWMVSKLNRL